MKKKFVKFTATFLIINIFFPLTAFAYEPNDPQFSVQNYLKQIHAPEAWDLQRRADDVVVAVIDTGVDMDNPELFNSFWKNKNEIPNNNIDDDNNGYVDDVDGWNFVANNNNPRPSFYSDVSRLAVSHGTVVAGLIAAEQDNGIGISGLAPGAKIMALRALSSKGDGKFEDVIKAIFYAINNGAKIINLSMVSDGTSDEFEQVIKEAVDKNIIVVSASGNETDSSYDNDTSINLNSNPRYPLCSNNGVGVLGVGSVNDQDIKSPFSNYGSNCLDVSAPGERFISVSPFNPAMDQYRAYTNGYFSGTSVSSPLVAATAALIWQRNPKLTAAEVENYILNNGDNIDSLNSRFLGQLGKRLNVYRSIMAVSEYAGTNTYVAGSVTGEEPWVYVFDESGYLNKKFLAYDQRFKGGIRVASIDVNNDGINEIVTVPGFGGGPHLRIFNQQGELLSQFMVGNNSDSGGLALATIKNNIVVVNQNSKQPVVKTYNWQGTLLNSFNLKKESYNTSTWLATLNNENQINDKFATLNSTSNKVAIYNHSGELLNEWELPFDQKLASDFYSVSNDQLVVVAKSKSYIFNLTGTLLKIYENGLVKQAGNDYMATERTLNQFITNGVAGKTIKTVDKLLNKIGNLRFLTS